MPWSPVKSIGFALLSATFLPAQETIRILNPPVAGTPGPSGWRVEPGRGNLSLSIPIGTVPGALPIPVIFSMNGTFMSYCTGILPLPNVFLSVWRDFGVHGTLGFGYIGWGRQNGAAGNKMFVLEDGRTCAETEFLAPFGWSVPNGVFGLGLLSAYGVDATGLLLRISTDATLAWVRIPAAQLRAKFAATVASHAPAGFGAVRNYDLVMDKDRIRVFAEVEAVCPPYLVPLQMKHQNPNAPIGVPVYWGDRFGHSVTFQWTKATEHLPPGLGSLVRVDALNQRNQGVTVRYANWDDDTTLHDLLRADFVGCEGPSVFMRGYSGTAVKHPVGFANLYSLRPVLVDIPLPIYLGGIVARPTSILLGDPNAVDEPSWNNLGCFPATPPVLPAAPTGCATQAWSLGYDENLAAVTSITTPSLVETRFSGHQRDPLVEGSGAALPALLWGATQALETDTSGKSSYTHTTTWDHMVPSPSENAWAQPNWIVTRREGWNHGGETPPDRTATYTFASPATSLLDYRNLFLQSCQLTDGINTLTTTTESTTRNNRGGGLDGSLSIPETVTTVRSAEQTRKVHYTYIDGTCLQVQAISHQVGNGETFEPAQLQTFSYDDQRAMLENHQVKQLQTTRYDHGTALSPAATTTNIWDPFQLLQLCKTFQEAGSCRHGQCFSYDLEGRLSGQDIQHVESTMAWAV